MRTLEIQTSHTSCIALMHCVVVAMILYDIILYANCCTHSCDNLDLLNIQRFATANSISIQCSASTHCGVLVLTVDAALPKIRSVVVTPRFVGTSPNANPSLEVSWTAVDDPAVSYVVRYSRLKGTVTAPPGGAGRMSANEYGVTLSENLAPDKRNPYTYYIWVAAVSAGVMGEYSERIQGVTLHSELSVINP